MEFISNDVMEASVVRAVELLEELAPPAAALLAARAAELDDAVVESGGDPDVEALAQWQMLGAALFHCVQTLEMIRAAADAA